MPSLKQSVIRSFAHYLDKTVLYTMNRRVPESLEASSADAPTFETVVAQTAVNLTKTPEYTLSAPGKHRIWLHGYVGELNCEVQVRPARDPNAPLLIYHHGLSEIPYDGSFRRLFPKSKPHSTHLVCIQAPYHDSLTAPFSQGFSSIAHIYQMFAGSLRMMELMQNHFEQQGAAYTILAGISWGGITSMLYEGLFRRTTAVIPMLSSPNLAQVMMDSADMFKRPLTLPPRTLQQFLDFTPYYEKCDFDCIFPLLGELDLFFQYQNHEHIFAESNLSTTPYGHLTGIFDPNPIRSHVNDVLQKVAQRLERTGQSNK
ncbi:MAG: hypothetical protein AAF614_26995 [Chloroflexota bacterium]